MLGRAELPLVGRNLMSTNPRDEAITSASDFEAALGELLATGVRNGIGVRGSWVYNSDDGGDNWEVMIYELAGEDALAGED